MTESIRIGSPPALPPAPKRKRKSIWVPVAITAVAVLAFGGFALVGRTPSAATKPSPPANFTVYATMQLTLGQFAHVHGEGCWGRGGYDDIAEGAQVVVTDASGTTVGVGSLGDSRYDDSRGRCTFSAIVKDVPDGSRFYAIEVSHRGRVQYSRADLDQAVTLSIG